MAFSRKKGGAQTSRAASIMAFGNFCVEISGHGAALRCAAESKDYRPFQISLRTGVLSALESSENCPQAWSIVKRGITMRVFEIAGVALVLLLCHPAYIRGVDSALFLFPEEDMSGLQSLWGAWNASTPAPSSNLLNWYSPTDPADTPWPCYASRNWRGVTCLRYFFNASVVNTWVVGLHLDDASISGTLPPGINQLGKLVSLKLTGNPGLGGSLPKELADTPLNILDLHDNGFNGTIPEEFSKVGNLLELDLSGNQFSGDYPFHIFGQMMTIQVLKIARNLFSGNVPSNAFENMTQLLTLDLSGNGFTGPSPKFDYTFADSTLYYLNLSRNNFSELPEISQIFKSWLPQNVGVLDLSGLNVGGALPADWSAHPDLLSRDELYLDETNISGVLDVKSILSGIQNLTKDSNLDSRMLRVLSLMNNSITDVIFDKEFLNSSGVIKFYLGGNPYCTTASTDADGRRCFCEEYCAISEPPKKSDNKTIIISTVICGVLLGAVILFLAIIIHRKSKHMDNLMKRFEASGVRAKRYEHNELRLATKNFSEERKLGQGACGAVYKGTLTNNTHVAVKRLRMKTKQASEDFLNEVFLITNLQHRNLVALKGYCLHGKEMLLVYEFVDFCDLDKLLFRDSTSVSEWQLTGWPARKHICLGVAQGLYYLHASSQTKIIHRDIKASNILLDKDLNAKIADFGLARPIEDEQSEIITQQRAGTLGYVAPEYMLYGQLSEKADVYSFGVLLLEIVSGTRNKDPTQSEDDVYLPTRAWKLYKEDRLTDVMDSRLHMSRSEEMEVQRVLETAVMCVDTCPEKRPTMFRVVAMLAGNEDEDDAAVPLDDSKRWPEYRMSSRLCSEDLLLVASSSTTGSTTTGPATNGNATIELSTLFTR